MNYMCMFDLQRWLVLRSTAVMSPVILLQSSLTQRGEMWQALIITQPVCVSCVQVKCTMSCWGSQPLIESAAVCEDATCNLSVRCVWSPHDQMMSTDKDFCFMTTGDLIMKLLMDSSKTGWEWTEGCKECPVAVGGQECRPCCQKVSHNLKPCSQSSAADRAISSRLPLSQYHTLHHTHFLTHPLASHRSASTWPQETCSPQLAVSTAPGGDSTQVHHHQQHMKLCRLCPTAPTRVVCVCTKVVPGTHMQQVMWMHPVGPVCGQWWHIVRFSETSVYTVLEVGCYPRGGCMATCGLIIET